MKEDECFGKVAKCKHGKVGVIYLKRYGVIGEKADTITYIGISLDGSRWQSKDPEILANNLDEYINVKN